MVFKGNREKTRSRPGTKRVALLLLIVLFSGASAYAYDFSAVASGTWTNSSNWTPAGVPGALDTVYIGSPFVGSLSAATIGLTQDQSASTIWIGWTGQSTLDLGSNNLSVSNLYVGRAGRPGIGQITRSTGTIAAQSVTIYDGNSFGFRAGDSVTSLTTQGAGAVSTTSTSSDITGNAYTYFGARLNLGAPLNVSNSVVVNAGSTLDANGRSITAGTITLGSSTGSANLLNRGTLTASTLALNSQNFNLLPVDKVDLLTLDNKSTSTLEGNSVDSANLFNSSLLSTTSTGSVTGSMSLFGKSVVELGADLNLSRGLSVNQGSTLNANGHKVTTSRLSIDSATGGPSLANDIGTLITDSLSLSQSSTLWLRGEGNSIALGSLTNQSFSLTTGSKLGYLQSPGSSVGLTFGTIASGTFTIDSTSLLELTVGAGSTSGWLMRWRNPNSGNRIGDLTTLMSSGRILVLGASGFELADNGGYTYLNFTAVPEPSSIALMLCAVPFGIFLNQRRRKQGRIQLAETRVSK